MRTCLALRRFNLTTCLTVSDLILAALTGCRSASRETSAHPAVPSQPLPKANTLSDLQQAAAQYHSVVEAGDSRDINISIRQFLGRAPSNDPFLIKIGAKKP